jgi:hypothetical protein
MATSRGKLWTHVCVCANKAEELKKRVITLGFGPAMSLCTGSSPSTTTGDSMPFLPVVVCEDTSVSEVVRATEPGGADCVVIVWSLCVQCADVVLLCFHSDQGVPPLLGCLSTELETSMACKFMISVTPAGGSKYRVTRSHLNHTCSAALNHELKRNKGYVKASVVGNTVIPTVVAGQKRGKRFRTGNVLLAAQLGVQATADVLYKALKHAEQRNTGSPFDFSYGTPVGHCLFITIAL